MYKDMFIKKFKSEELALAEFDRTLEIYNKVLGQKCLYLQIARPEKIEGTSVYFEKINNCLNLREMTYKLFVKSQILFNVGYALGELHLTLNPNSFSLENQINIHSDFWSRNVLINSSNGKVFIVDFSPATHRYSEACPVGYAYKDLGQMIHGLEVKYPIYKPYLLTRIRKNRLMSVKFIKGYEKAINKKIDLEKLSEFLIKHINISKNVFKEKNPISSFIWTRLLDKAIGRYSRMREIEIMNLEHSNQDYRTSHTQVQKGEQYKLKSFAKNTTVRTLWQMELAFLEKTIEEQIQNRDKYLDFACGTGRIIEALGHYFKKAEGVDVSPSMLEMAKNNGTNAKFILADITSKKELIGSNYDLITAFRFFLKAQDSLCNEVITILVEKMSRGGFLVFNIHNSKPSLLALQNGIINIFRTHKVPSKSRKQIEKFVRSADLEIVNSVGLAIVPKALHGILTPRLWTIIDTSLCKIKFLQLFASDIIYICRKTSPIIP